MRIAALSALLCTMAAADVPSDPTYFTRSVYPVLQKAGCAGCHNPDGVASATRLQFPDSTAPDAEIERFGRSLASLIDRTTPEKSLLIQKPTRRIPHAGGKRIAPGSPDEKALLDWAAHLATLPAANATETNGAACANAKPVLRRLTHTQYDNTIRDLLGDDSRVAGQFPPEDFVNGFKGQYESQSISPLLAEAYAAAAETLARSAFRGGDPHHLIPCKPASASDASCRDQFIRAFGRKAFRRPLLDAEAARYSRLFAAEAVPGKSFLAGAQIVVEAMLQSPAFLTRTENGSNPKWTSYETASRLSYFILNTMPDAGLLAAAESGELSTPEGVEKAARRLLKDPRAHQALDQFIAEWLRFDRLIGSVKDRRSFPMYSLELSVAMTEETRRLASYLVWQGRNFLELYSADYAFLNSDLAALYKLPTPPAEFARVPLPPESGRAGVLGEAAFLGLTSKPEDTSPTARGLFVREQFLCQEVPPPPPGVNTNLPANAKETPRTNQERQALHLSNESCASCHSLIDPIGFGLEKYDAIGGRREMLKIRFEPAHAEKGEATTVEVPLRSEGFIAGIPDSQFDSPRTLGAVLARSKQCQECVVKQLFRFATGRRESISDRPVIAKSFEDFQKSGFQLQELMVSLMRWSVFPPGRNSTDGVSCN